MKGLSSESPRYVVDRSTGAMIGTSQHVVGQCRAGRRHWHTLCSSLSGESPGRVMADTFIRRLMGAALLDPDTYEDVEADPTATPQAAAVIILASLAAGIGA